MNKFLILSVLFGVLVFSSAGVIADTGQGINASVGENISLIITPTTVEFGQVAPGTDDNDATSGDITFDAEGSNVNVNIEVTNVSGFPFETGLMLDGMPALGEFWDLMCVIDSELCTYTPATTTPTLDVPVGAPPGVKPGTITYTITGTPPD